MTSPVLLNNIDESFSHTKVSRTYPHIFLRVKHAEPLPVLIGILEEGTLPIFYEHENVCYELKRVNVSPLNLIKLLKVYAFDVHISEEKTIHISSNTELMEAYKWML